MRRHYRFLAIPIALFALACGAAPGPSAGSDEPQWLELPTEIPAGPPTPLPTMTTLDLPTPRPPSALPATPITSANIADLSLARMIGLGQATSAAFHPSGEYLVVGTTGGLVWYRLPGLEFARFDREAGADDVSFSPWGDRVGFTQLIDRSRYGGGVTLAGTGVVEYTLTGNAPTFSPDGALVANSLDAAMEEYLSFIETADGYRRDQLQGSLPRFSADSTLLATVEYANSKPFGLEATTRVYDITASPPPLLLERPGFAPAISPDNGLLAVATGDAVALHTLPGGELRASIPTGGPAVSRFSPDEATLLILAGPDVLVWDVAAGSQIRRLTNVSVAPASDEAGPIVFSPDLTALATAARPAGPCEPAGVRIVALDDGSVLYEDTASREVQFSWDGRQAALVSDAGVRVVDLASGASADAPLSSYLSVAISPADGTIAAARVAPDGEGGSAGLVELWEPGARSPKATLRSAPAEHVLELTRLRFTPDGARVAGIVGYGCDGPRSFKVVAWDTASGAVAAEIPDLPRETDDQGRPTDQLDYLLSFYPSGELATWMDATEQVVLWRPEGPTPLDARPGFVMQFAEDGSRLAVGDHEGGVKIFSLPDGRLIDSWYLDPEREWTSVTFALSPDATTLVSSITNRRRNLGDQIVVSELPGGREIGRIENEVSAGQARFISADELLFFGGAGLAISSLDGAVYGGFTASGSEADLSPDRRFAVTLTRGIVTLWGVR